MNTLRTFSEERQQKVIDITKSYLPESAELACLSFTGGRAFGWGDGGTDYDIRGFFVKNDWFHKCHYKTDAIDATVYNIYSFEDPQVEAYRWKRFYDMSNPFFIHDSFNYYEDFMDKVDIQKIHHVYPYSLNMELDRMRNARNARQACHAYKEILIPLNFIYNDEIETDVRKIANNQQFDLDALDQVIEGYAANGGENSLDWDLIEDELEGLLDELGELMPADKRGNIYDTQ